MLGLKLKHLGKGPLGVLISHTIELTKYYEPIKQMHISNCEILCMYDCFKFLIYLYFYGRVYILIQLVNVW